MATFFKLVLADMTIPTTKNGEQSEMMKMGYGLIVNTLEEKLRRVTRLIPKIFNTAVVMITPFNSRPSLSPDDALVHIEPMPERSILPKEVRIAAINDRSVAGKTVLGLPGGNSICVPQQE